jgi:hypothetical protein
MIKKNYSVVGYSDKNKKVYTTRNEYGYPTIESNKTPFGTRLLNAAIEIMKAKN